MIKTGIIGSTGYVAGELLRVLVAHPEVEIKWLISKSSAGKKVSEVHADLFELDHLAFSEKSNDKVDVVFLCTGHGHSKEILNQIKLDPAVKIIDLSSDFRLSENSFYKGKQFVYGLTEEKEGVIKKANAVANPGCFATAIELGLMPLFKEKMVKSDVHIHGITGSTGAGKGLSETSHFSWRNNNLSAYKVFTHQHMDEVKELLKSFSPEYNKNINFVPIRGCFTRGILISLYFDANICQSDLMYVFETEYQDAPFVHISTDDIDLKQVVNTNHALIQPQKIDNKVHVTVVIDNLLKGASGQAIQNMNLMFGLDQKTGLNLKASYF